MKLSIIKIKYSFYTFLWILFIIILSKLVSIKFYSVPGYNINFSNINSYFFIFVIFLSFIPSLFLNPKERKPSNIFFAIFYYFHFIPSIILVPIILYKYEVFSKIIVLFYFIIFILFIYFYNKYHRSSKILKLILKNNFPKNLSSYLLWIIIFIILIYLINNSNFIHSLPSIFQVYNIRSKFKEDLAEKPELFGYLYINIGYIFSPFLLLKGITSKDLLNKIILIFISIILSLFIFSISGLKSVAFSIIIVFSFFIFLKKSKTWVYSFSKYLVLFSYIFLILMLLFNNFIVENILLHWMRRISIVQGMNVAYHLDFLIKNNLLFINDYLSLRSMPIIISNTYYFHDGNAPAGLLGSMFEMGGIIGVLLSFFLLFIILYLLDNIAKFLNEEIIISLSFPLFYAITGTIITSVFLTYGFILLLLLILLKFYNLNWIKK